jgi:hypothetical protein
LTLNPLGPIASQFYLDNSEIACIMGPVGSAKTTASAFRLVRHAYAQRPYENIRYTRFFIVRNTGPQLVDTTMKSWFKLFPSGTQGRKWTSTTRTQTWRFTPKGSKYMIHAEFSFRALDDDDDVANLLSLEATGFWFNELREIHPDLLAAAGRRAGRYPGADMGACTWRGWIGDTNPWAATSDQHNWFVADPRPGYKFFKQPGGMDPDAENLENLEQTAETLLLPYNDPVRREQGRTYYINALRDYSKADADMYVHCKYGASRAGKPVYESYDDNAHCKEFELERGKDKAGKVFTPIRIGYDNTGRTPAALISQLRASGQWRHRYEFIGSGMGMKAHAAALRVFLTQKIPDFRIERITCDPAGAQKGADDLDMRMIVQREFPGVQVLNARTNDIATRIMAVEQPLRRFVEGEPAVLIHPDCKTLRTACLQKYQYRKMKVAGEERYTEEPDKNAKPWCDIADAMQYQHLGGGEGRLLEPNEQGANFKWPQGGTPAIQPKEPEEQRKRREQRGGSAFDPRSGSVFVER